MLGKMGKEALKNHISKIQNILLPLRGDGVSTEPLEKEGKGRRQTFMLMEDTSTLSVLGGGGASDPDT